MLRYWDGLFSRWNSGSLLKDAALVFHPSNFQLPSFVSSALWTCPKSSASGTKVGTFTRECKCLGSPRCPDMTGIPTCFTIRKLYS